MSQVHPSEVAALAGCTGKVRFESFAVAKRVQDRRAQRGRDGGPYKCRHCGAWHIGQRFTR